MKKISMILGAALLCLAGCNKTETTMAPQHLKLDLTIHNQMAPATKSVKTDWADGDKIYVFFGLPEEHPTPAYLTLTRSGSSWTEAWTEGLEAEIAATTSGTLTAFFSPMDIDSMTYFADLKWYYFYGGNYCFALTCNNVPYDVSAGVLSATMDLALSKDTFVQFFLPGEADNVANLTFSSDLIMKSMGAGMIDETGKVGTGNSNYSEPIPGFAFDGGIIFSGMLLSTVSGNETDYTFTIVDSKGTDDTSDDVTYTLTKTATISQKDAILLPALSEWSVLPELVDLGLPSGLKWAKCNLGASTETDYGDYFAWGEIAPKTDYSWATYKWMQEGKSEWMYMTKYSFSDGWKEGIWYDGDTFVGDDRDGVEHEDLASYGYEDDAARAALGGGSRMPSAKDWNELHEDCTWDWKTTDDGYAANGFLVTGPNGNTIFLPAAGFWNGTSHLDEGTYGHYLSSSLAFRSDCMMSMRFTLGSIGADISGRYYGESVRPVSD